MFPVTGQALQLKRIQCIASTVEIVASLRLSDIVRSWNKAGVKCCLQGSAEKTAMLGLYLQGCQFVDQLE